MNNSSLVVDPPTHLSLFSGIGGIDLAAEWAGFQTVAFVERDPFCQKVLAKHWPEVPIYDDVRTVGPLGRRIDLLSGGFPCQPFSLAGKQRGDQDDRFLWPAMLGVIAQNRPSWVLAENVPGLIAMALDDCLSDLENSGYTTRALVLPACGVGAPHRRERVFIVAHLHTDSDGGRQQERSQLDSEPIEGTADRSSCGSHPDGLRDVVADANRQGRQDAQRCAGQAQPTGRNIALPKSTERGTHHWELEPNVGRVANGIPRRVDRLRALGNAVVPAQVFPILSAIANELRKSA